MLYSLALVDRRFRDVIAFIIMVIREMIALIMKAVRTSETSAYSNEINSAMSQKVLIFILAFVRT
jgi:hypothetical protein